MPELTILNTYRLLGTAAAFETAIGALAARVRDEGEPGVMAYRFFVSDSGGTARAVIDYATPEAWIGHHERSMGWPEMKALHKVARLDEVVFLGPLTPKICAWLDGSGLRARVVDGYRQAAGFSRA